MPKAKKQSKSEAPKPIGEQEPGYILKGLVKGKIKILGTCNGPAYEKTFKNVLANSKGVTDLEVLQIDMLTNQITKL